MIRLLLRGFQSHKDTTMEFGGGFVCITGPNNAGKSAIIRAVRWLMYDALHGSRFIKKGSSEAQAELQIGDAKVGRVKSKSKNQYRINGTEMDSVGVGVPIEVSQAIGIRPVKVDKDQELEINIQQDTPFLMDLTGALKAKVLNVLTGSNVIDMASRESVADSRRLIQEQTQLTTRRESLLQEQEQFIGLPALEARVGLLRACQRELEELVVKAQKMRDLKNQYEAAVARLVKHVIIPDRREEVQGLLNRIVELRKRVENAKAYQLAVSRLSKHATLSDRREEVQKLLDRISELRKMVESAKAYKNAVSKMKEVQSDLSLYQMQMQRAQEQMRMLVGTRCKACGQSITDKCLQEAA